MTKAISPTRLHASPAFSPFLPHTFSHAQKTDDGVRGRGCQLAPAGGGVWLLRLARGGGSGIGVGLVELEKRIGRSEELARGGGVSCGRTGRNKKVMTGRGGEKEWVVAIGRRRCGGVVLGEVRDGGVKFRSKTRE
ncbi:hypothetical protein Drorol1_Dr00015364 [Drosera rotundifolia]